MIVKGQKKTQFYVSKAEEEEWEGIKLQKPSPTHRTKQKLVIHIVGATAPAAEFEEGGGLNDNLRWVY